MLHIWSHFGDPSVNGCWVKLWIRWFWIFKIHLTLKMKVNCPPPPPPPPPTPPPPPPKKKIYIYIYRSEINLKGLWVMGRTSSGLTHTHGYTGRRRQRQYPKCKTGLGQKQNNLMNSSVHNLSESYGSLRQNNFTGDFCSTGELHTPLMS